jgi:hypothetical protein
MAMGPSGKRNPVAISRKVFIRSSLDQDLRPVPVPAGWPLLRVQPSANTTGRAEGAVLLTKGSLRRGPFTPS